MTVHYLYGSLAVAVAGSAATIDLSQGIREFEITLDSGVNTLTFANPVSGQNFRLKVTQPAAGAAGTLAFAGTVTSARGVGAIDLQTVNSAIDFLFFRYESGTSFTLLSQTKESEGAEHTHTIANAGHPYVAADVGKIVRLTPADQQLAIATPGNAGFHLLTAQDAAGYTVSAAAFWFTIAGANFGTPFAMVYLSPTVSGGLTETRPSTAGQVVAKIGQVLSSADTIQLFGCSDGLLLSSVLDTSTASGLIETNYCLNTV